MSLNHFLLLLTITPQKIVRQTQSNDTTNAISSKIKYQLKEAVFMSDVVVKHLCEKLLKEINFKKTPTQQSIISTECQNRSVGF